MKNAIMVLISGVAGVIILAILMTIGGRMNRSVEIQSSLSSAMEKPVAQMMDETEAHYDACEAVAACMERIAVAVETDSDIRMEVYGIDDEKGVMAIRVSEIFKHPNGVESETEWERTVIYDKTETERRNCYEVRFYRSKADMLGEGRCYKSYMVQEGEQIAPPASPVSQGVAFAEWKDINDYIADFSQPIEEDRSYYAEWE